MKGETIFDAFKKAKQQNKFKKDVEIKILPKENDLQKSQVKHEKI